MNVLKGFIWKILQQYSTYFMKLAFQVILARILSPNEFGILAEILVFITVAEAFANGGFGTALIQKKDADAIDFGTSIISSFIISIFLYLVIFFTSPAIAKFYAEEELVPLLRIFGLSIPFYSFNSIQNAYLLKKYETKAMFFSSFVSTVLSGGISVYFAYKDRNAFSLVLQSFLYTLFNVIGLLLLTKWKPKIIFSSISFKSLFSFSWKMVLSNVLGNVLENIYNLFIGKSYNSEILGYYNRGNSFPSILIGQLRTAISTVTLPYFSSNQERRESLIKHVKKITHLSVLIMFPIAFGLAAISEPLVRLLLTDKWLPCVFFIRLECIFYGFLPIAASVSNGMISIGRSDLNLKVEGIKFFLTLLTILFTGKQSIEILCISRVIISILMILITVIFSRKVIGYGFKTLFNDIFTPFMLSLGMGVICYFWGNFFENLILKVITEVILGFLIYGISCFLFLKDDILEFKNIILNYMNSKSE